MTRIKESAVCVYRWRVFDPWMDVLRAGITTRTGGYSSGHLSSLNLGHRVDDKPSSLSLNRAATARALGVPGAPWAVANQVHSTRLGIVNKNPDRPYDSCDALYLREKRVIAAILLADCLPVVLYDRHRHCGIVCHAGWRGTAAGIARLSVERLLCEGSRIEDIVAAAGPGIGPCCYPVGEEVAAVFSKRVYPEDVVQKNESGEYRLNLEQANLAQLRSCGISEDHLGSAGFCTACRQDEFFSYRKERGLTGRHAALMVLL